MSSPLTPPGIESLKSSLGLAEKAGWSPQSTSAALSATLQSPPPQLPSDSDSIHSIAATPRGWQRTLALSKDQLASFQEHSNASLQVRLTRAVALLSSGSGQQAVDELAELGDLNSATYSRLNVPWSLRYITAIAPWYASDPELSIRRLHALLGVSETAVGDRRARTQGALVAIYASKQDYIAAAGLLETIIASNPNAPSWISALGRLHLSIGDIETASDLMSLASRHESASRLDIAVDAAFLCMGRGEYGDAVVKWEEVLKLSPGHVGAVNNRSVCLLYSGHLSDAVAVLEGAAAAEPSKMLTAPLLFNLATLYELISDSDIEKKSTLKSVANRHGPQGVYANSTFKLAR